MKTFPAPSLRGPLLLGCLLASVLTCTVASAQVSLVNYFDFTQYGTVTGGSTVTSNLFGSTQGTLSSASTTLTSAGLAITPGATVNTTGITLAAGSLSSFTGDFSIQTWYTNPATVVKNTMLFGGTTSATIDNSLNGDRGLFVGFNVTPNKVRPIASNNTTFGADMATNGQGITASALVDLAITYVSSTKLFTLYINGAQAGTMTMNAGFTTLADVTNWAIGGVANPAFGDKTAGATFTSFLMYSGALDSTQVSSIHNFGADATVSEITSITAIPEPATYGMIMGASLLVAVAMRRRTRNVKCC